MALDGIVIASLADEFSRCLIGGRISRIAQPEPDELLLTVKAGRDTYKLLLSASAGLPLAYFTENTFSNPATAPNFCMLLRKHIGNGRILSVRQPGLERILDIEVEHLDELGDLQKKHLIIELMGKHSNIIFCEEGGRIIDSIKHVSAQMSSVREVLPGRQWFIPDTMHKLNPLELPETEIRSALASCSRPGHKAFYTLFTGISPAISEEVLFRAGIDGAVPCSELDELSLTHLAHTFFLLLDEVKSGQFFPSVYYLGQEPVEFSSLQLSSLTECARTDFDSPSRMLEQFYAEKNQAVRIRQKSAELRKVVQTLLERSRKKYDLQEKQLKDTEKRDKYRLYGELLTTYGYQLPAGEREAKVVNFYDNQEITIPLDDTMSPLDNAKRYYEKYSKQKRTCEALTGHLQETGDEISHLESIAASIDMAQNPDDLVQIKEELIQCGYMRRHVQTKGRQKVKLSSRPWHYLSSDGFDIYVGRNNLQNEELTFKFAEGKDLWFHAKKIPGSHVIVKTGGRGFEIPDRTCEEAASLAAYYSQGRNAEKVEIDYIDKKQVKKPAGGKPGFVIYHSNFSMVAAPDISGPTLLEE